MPSKSARGPGLRARVRDLVESRFLGSVNAAAKAWGVPQPTLRRITEGLSARPRADVLARIARANETTVEWLLTGEGSAPLQRTSEGTPALASIAEWRRIVEALQIAQAGHGRLGVGVEAPEALRVLRERPLGDITLHKALLDLPRAPLNAGLLLDVGNGLRFMAGDTSDPLYVAARAALDASARMWTVLFQHAIAQLGVDEVRERLRFFYTMSASGFTGFSMWLEQAKPDLFAELLVEFGKRELEDLVHPPEFPSEMVEALAAEGIVRGNDGRLAIQAPEVAEVRKVRLPKGMLKTETTAAEQGTGKKKRTAKRRR